MTKLWSRLKESIGRIFFAFAVLCITSAVALTVNGIHNKNVPTATGPSTLAAAEFQAADLATTDPGHVAVRLSEFNINGARNHQVAMTAAEVFGINRVSSTGLDARIINNTDSIAPSQLATSEKATAWSRLTVLGGNRNAEIATNIDNSAALLNTRVTSASGGGRNAEIVGTVG